MNSANKIERGSVVRCDEDVWTVVAVGAEHAGAVYTHLASTTRFVGQKNGRRPVQVCGWYRSGVLTTERP